MRKTELTSKIEIKVYDNGDVVTDARVKSMEDATFILSEMMFMMLDTDMKSGVAIIETAKEIAIERLAKKSAEEFFERHDISNINSLGEAIDLFLKDMIDKEEKED